jgi:hypothetical protein
LNDLDCLLIWNCLGAQLSLSWLQGLMCSSAWLIGLLGFLIGKDSVFWSLTGLFQFHQLIDWMQSLFGRHYTSEIMRHGVGSLSLPLVRGAVFLQVFQLTWTFRHTPLRNSHFVDCWDSY